MIEKDVSDGEKRDSTREQPRPLSFKPCHELFEDNLAFVIIHGYPLSSTLFIIASDIRRYSIIGIGSQMMLML